MAAKILLSVSPLFWLLLFCSDSGLQGVRASPLSKTSADPLDVLRSLHPKKISVIKETVSGNHKDQRGIEIAELLYDGLVLTLGIPSNSTLDVAYPDDWQIIEIYGNVTWLEGDGDVSLEIGPNNDSWSITFLTFEWVYGYYYDLVVVINRPVSTRFILLQEYSKYRTIRLQDRK
jgi:hypothetical protein